MSQPTRQELEESIKELTAFRNRLQKEVEMVARKLGMPKNKIESSIDNHAELKKINKILGQLNTQIDLLDQS